MKECVWNFCYSLLYEFACGISCTFETEFGSVVNEEERRPQLKSTLQPRVTEHKLLASYCKPVQVE